MFALTKQKHIVRLFRQPTMLQMSQFMGLKTTTPVFSEQVHQEPSNTEVVPDQTQLTEAQRHAKSHVFKSIDSKYYENDFVHTSIKELEYVRSPFYEMAQHQHL